MNDAGNHFSKIIKRGNMIGDESAWKDILRSNNNPVNFKRNA